MWAAEENRKRRIWCVVAVITLQLMSWVSATSRPFPPPEALLHQQGQSPMSSIYSKQALLKDSQSMEAEMVNEEAYRGMSTIGSRPPNCQHKCGGCVPCEAIQVPTSNDQLRVQYANYEPEGWKCKCGSSFFSP